jgi:hypothetical protein
MLDVNVWLSFSLKALGRDEEGERASVSAVNLRLFIVFQYDFLRASYIVCLVYETVVLILLSYDPFLSLFSREEGQGRQCYIAVSL